MMNLPAEVGRVCENLPFGWQVYTILLYFAPAYENSKIITIERRAIQSRMVGIGIEELD